MSYINRIVIEKENLINNIDVIKNKAQSATIIAVLKGNSYGIGNEILPKLLINNGIDFFAVTEVQEAVSLREMGYFNEILVLNSTCIPEEVSKIVTDDCTATIGSYECFEVLLNECKKQNKKIKAHIKIDTGFSRFGFNARELLDDDEFNRLIGAFKKQDFIEVTGVYTHFQESYSNDSKRTYEQFNLFSQIVEKFKNNNIKVMCHCSNSSALFKYPNMNLDAVRIGSAFSGRLQVQNDTGLKKVGFFETQICEIKNLAKGSKIGYSGTCTLKRDTKVGICEAGYFDGIFINGPKDSSRIIDKLRKLKRLCKEFFADTNRYVMINNKRVPILGRIGMKNFVVDLSSVEASVGDKVKIDVNLVLSNQTTKRELV